ncbi:MAG TPA: hypothetical protein VMV18_06105 [bacterium]|nr:hypothetical protein [bacterium]
MKKLIGWAAGIAVVFAVSSLPRHARAEDADRDDDFAIRLLHRVERLHGGASSPLEEKLRGKLEQMSAMEAGDGGGFEPPPDAPTAAAPTNDDEQFSALQDITSKMAPVERVKAGIWFLVIMPGTKHHDDVQRLIDTNATQMKPNEQADFQDYMGVRRSLSGSSASTRISRWTDYKKAKPQSSFAELANREVEHLKSIEKEKSSAKKAGAFNVLVKVGIVVLVLALIGVIVFGAAK